MTNISTQSIHLDLAPFVLRDLVWILVFAVIVSLATYNGAFGSDDLTYFARSAELARGEWSTANYNGALRYGFNLPAAALITLFGESLFVANLWPLACSLLEIVAVFLFASFVFSKRVAIFAALLLATAPLHIAVATRIHADPVVSMFVTVGFVLLYFGLIHTKPKLLFAAGLSIGGIFWAKELAAVTWFAFIPILVIFRGQWRKFMYVFAGAILMMVAHGLLMLYIAGDPFHLIKVVLSALKRNYIDAPQSESGPAYYLRYLFVDVRHTGLLGFFCVLSILLWPKFVKQGDQFHSGYIFILAWWFGLLLVLSIFPVSLSPLRFPMKQSNYITLFLAPTALLAALAISSFPKKMGYIFIALSVGGGILLGALQQADYRAFTANSKALAAFAVEHPHSMIVGSTNNKGMGNLWKQVEFPLAPGADIDSFRDLGEKTSRSEELPSRKKEIFAVIDMQTINWFSGKDVITLPLPCWDLVKTLEPIGLGLGNELAKLLTGTLRQFTPVPEVLIKLVKPQRAEVFLVSGSDVLCK